MTPDTTISPFTEKQTAELLRKCDITRPELDQKKKTIKLPNKACKISSALILYIEICFTQREKATNFTENSFLTHKTDVIKSLSRRN